MREQRGGEWSFFLFRWIKYKFYKRTEPERHEKTLWHALNIIRAEYTGMYVFRPFATGLIEIGHFKFAVADTGVQCAVPSICSVRSNGRGSECRVFPRRESRRHHRFRSSLFARRKTGRSFPFSGRNMAEKGREEEGWERALVFLSYIRIDCYEGGGGRETTYMVREFTPFVVSRRCWSPQHQRSVTRKTGTAVETECAHKTPRDTGTGRRGAQTMTTGQMVFFRFYTLLRAVVFLLPCKI